MSDFKQNLRDVMHKIANYVPWQEEQVDENDFRILNQASGTDLAEISYKYRINIYRFIKNVNKLIDDYNEKVLLNRIQDVNTIKRSLQTAFAFKVDSKKKESVLKENSSEELIDINEQLFQRGIITRETYINRAKNIPPQIIPNFQEGKVPETAAPSFVSNLQTELESHALSLHRDNSKRPDISHRIKNITADKSAHSHELEPKLDFNNLDDFGELNDDDVARLGFFDGEGGEKIYHSLQNRKTLGEVMPYLADKSISLPTNENLNLEIPLEKQPSLQFELPELSVEAQELPILEKNLAELNFDNDLPQLLPTIQTTEFPPVDTHETTPVEHNVSDVFAERYENFRSAIEQAKKLADKKPKRRQRRALVRVTPSEDEDDDDDELRMFKIRSMDSLKKIPKRPQALKVEMIKPIVVMDVFSEIQAFNENFVPFEEAEKECSFRVETRNTSTPMPQHHLKRSIPSPTIQSNVKRLCTEAQDEFLRISDKIGISDEPSYAEIPVPETNIIIHSIEPIYAPPKEYEAPNIALESDIMPEQIRQAAPEPSPLLQTAQPITRIINKDLHDTIETISFPSQKLIEIQAKRQPSNIDSRRQLSSVDAVLESYAIKSAIEANKISHLQHDPLPLPITEPIKETLIPDQGVPEVEADLVRNIPTRRTSRKTRKTNGVKFVYPTEIINGEVFYIITDEESGTVIKESKYEFDTFMLYLQVRCLMKKMCGSNPWKMEVNALINDHKVEIGGKRDSTRIKIALRMLAHRGYFTPAFSDDGQEILEIEIPLNRRETTSSEKENFP